MPKSEGFESGINYLKRNHKYVSANGQVYLIIKEVPWNRVPVGKNKIRPTSGLRNANIQKRKNQNTKNCPLHKITESE